MATSDGLEKLGVSVSFLWVEPKLLTPAINICWNEKKEVNLSRKKNLHVVSSLLLSAGKTILYKTCIFYKETEQLWSLFGSISTTQDVS